MPHDQWIEMSMNKELKGDLIGIKNNEATLHINTQVYEQHHKIEKNH